MIHTFFEANVSKNIALPNLATSVFIVKLKSESSKLNKDYLKKTTINQKIETKNNTEEITKKDAIKKISNYCKYAALNALSP